MSIANVKDAVANALIRIEARATASDNSDVELVHRAAQDPRIRCFVSKRVQTYQTVLTKLVKIQDLCPALRLHDQEGREHPSQEI